MRYFIIEDESGEYVDRTTKEGTQQEVNEWHRQQNEHPFLRMREVGPLEYENGGKKWKLIRIEMRAVIENEDDETSFNQIARDAERFMGEAMDTMGLEGEVDRRSV